MKALVTGAARGLGLGLATLLKRKGYEVYAVCRKSTPELDALGVHIVPGVELSADASIGVIRKAIEGVKLDLVICNAGLNGAYDSPSTGIADFNLDMAAHEYQTNALGPVRTVVALLDNLRQGGKVILVTTGTGVTGKNPPSPGQWGYRMSKMALHTMGYQLADELRPKGVAVRLLSPGAIYTDLMRKLYAAGKISQDPSNLPDGLAAAERLWPRVDDLSLDSTGQWVNFDGKVFG